MKHGFIKAATATPKLIVADTAYNREQICSCIDEAVSQGAKLIVFPELCITGYTCQDLLLQELLLQEASKELLNIARHTKGMEALIFVGLPLVRENKLYNVAAAVFDGQVLGFIPKVHIPNYGEFYEGRHFARGNEEAVTYLFQTEEEMKQLPFGTNMLFDLPAIPGLRVGCELCEDVWAPKTPSTAHALAGATVIVNLSASNETIGKAEYRRQLMEATSARLMAAYVYAGAGTGESTQDLVFGGHNMIAENGTILAEGARFQGGIVYAVLDIQKLLFERRKTNTFLTEEKSPYFIVPLPMKRTETKLERKFASLPFVPEEEGTKAKRCEEILLIQSHGLKKRYEHTKLKKAVIGVSGGLDSTLALLVCARAFDLLGLKREHIVAVTMPCFGTTDRTYENACKLAKSLGATLREVNIKEAVTLHFSDIGQDMDNKDVTYENAQARERTQVIMDIANQEAALVIGTGDLSELALGWATYNGDHMSMYGVNGGVPKTLIRHLVQYEADMCGQEGLKEVLLDVLHTPVSPELLPPVDGNISQRTEELVGPYELHDFFLYYMLRWGFEPEKIFRIARETFVSLYDEDVIKKWLKIFYSRFFSQQFKRSCLPDGPKVGSVAVSPRGDLRMPSDASAQLWMKQLESL